MASEIDAIDARSKVLLAGIRAEFEGLRALNARNVPAPSFEAAMSMLTYAVSLVESSPPENITDHNRLTDQVGRLEAVESKARRALMNKEEI